MLEYIAAYLLFAVVIMLVGIVIWREVQHQRTVQTLLDRIMAKSFDEFKLADASQPKAELQPKPSPYAPIDQLDDKEFDTMIKQQVGAESVLDKATKTLKKIAAKE